MIGYYGIYLHCKNPYTRLFPCAILSENALAGTLSAQNLTQ
jgi:hypothetical protein